MAPRETKLEALPEWKRLAAHHRETAALHLRGLFAEDPIRGERMAVEAEGFYLDYSKNRITAETLPLLLALANARGLRDRIEAMFRGDPINRSEGRAALHVALRCPRGESIVVDGTDVVPEVHRVLDAMAAFAETVRDGAWLGHSGRRIRNVVNIGIGGSDLGPAMACDALRNYRDPGLRFRFVSNVDSADFAAATRDLDPAETLFVVCSKTFTTPETLANARTARAWCVAGLGSEDAVAKHFVAASTNVAEATKFGIDPAGIFEFWDWVGGRYSVGSAVGLSLMVAIGPESFRELLAGFHAMDRHFRTAPFERNLPVLMALIAIWYNNFFGAETHCVLPYSDALARFPAYLQQLCMESEGKSVDENGNAVSFATGPILWGQAGTNGQHAFYQLLHQGTRFVPCDFIGFCESSDPLGDHHRQLTANLLAQSAALAFGNTAADLTAAGVSKEQIPHRRFEGNRPSNTLLVDRLTPASLGKLIGLYEHRTFVLAALWGIDAFDQWGVELGKQIARRITPDLASGSRPASGHDSSTRRLIERFRASSRTA